MGDISDYYREQELNKHFNMSMYKDFEETPDNYNETFDYTVWTTKSGNKIFVKDMTNLHLVNTIKMIGKNNGSIMWLINLEKECKQRKLLIPKRPYWYQCDATESDIY